MATKVVYNLAVVTSSYVKDGKDKNHYENIGVVMEKDDGGRFILLNRFFNPAGVPNPENKDKVIISMFEPKTEGSDNI